MTLILHKVPKWSNNLKHLVVFAERLLKCAWPFWDIMHYRVNGVDTFKKSNSIIEIQPVIYKLLLGHWRKDNNLFPKVKTRYQIIFLAFSILNDTNPVTSSHFKYFFQLFSLQKHWYSEQFLWTANSCGKFQKLRLHRCWPLAVTNPKQNIFSISNLQDFVI